MKEIRFAIIGVGSMGTNHTKHFTKGDVPNAKLVAVCDTDPKAIEQWKDDDDVATWDDASALLNSGTIDAVLIATPHYAHTTIGAEALKLGIHTLTEKPISVHKADCERLIAAHTDEKVIFGAMFNQRSLPMYAKVRELINSGELGEITRINWVVTTWFRTRAYYEGGGWRATWEGEGGGVLLNQCPHQLDLLQWFFGMPSRVTAVCALGKRRDIEVEDEVSAILEYPNGATGVFVTCVSETPGTNRLEINGERGKLTVENDKIHFTRNEVPMTEYAETTSERFVTPPVWEIDIPYDKPECQAHLAIIINFVEAILEGKPLLAPAEEGINSIELGNAMLYSGLTKQSVDLPLDSAAYEECLKKLIAESTFVKTTVESDDKKMDGSF
jgi:predicted dehydrogenase